MNQKERVEEFLKELYELSIRYGFEVTGEGNSPLLYDTEKQDWACEFGASFCGSGYKAYFE